MKLPFHFPGGYRTAADTWPGSGGWEGKRLSLPPQKKKTKYVYFQRWTRVGGKHPQGLLLSLRGRSLAWRAHAEAARVAPKTEPGQGRGARTCPAGAGRRATATPVPGGGRGRFGLPRGGQPAAVDEGARHGTDGATQRRLSHAGGARPRPAPAAPTPPLIRQKDRQEGFPTCRALHVQSLSCLVKNGAGLEGRSGGRRRRRGAGRTPAPPAGTCSRPPPTGDEVVKTHGY